MKISLRRLQREQTLPEWLPPRNHFINIFFSHPFSFTYTYRCMDRCSLHKRIMATWLFFKLGHVIDTFPCLWVKLSIIIFNGVLVYHCTIIYLTSSWSLDIEVAASSFNLQRMVPQYGHSCSHLYSYLLKGISWKWCSWEKGYNFVYFQTVVGKPLL